MLVGALRQFSASTADQYVLGVSAVFGQEVSRKQIDVVAAFAADLGFDPKEVFHRGCRGTAKKALSSVQVTYFRLKLRGDSLGCLSVLDKVDVFDLFPNNPVRHRIDVVAKHVTPKSVRLKKRRATTHKRVRNPLTSQVVGLVKHFSLRPAGEFREQQ
jgi:hypothetical protein